MLCDRCRDRSHKLLWAREAALRGMASVGTLFCEGCGILLPATDSMDGMLRKLTQLARFGLDAESAPLLASGTEDV